MCELNSWGQNVLILLVQITMFFALDNPNRYCNNDEDTAEVVSHEIAHNLGIRHDCNVCAQWSSRYTGPRQARAALSIRTEIEHFEGH